MTRMETELDFGSDWTTQGEGLSAASLDGPTTVPGQDEARTVGVAMGVIRGRWVIPILTRLCVEPTQFNQLRRELGISSKVLTASLRALERDGLVARTPPDQPGKMGAYSVTARGSELQPALRALLEWARKHGGDLQESRIRFDRAARISSEGNVVDRVG